MDWLDVSNLNVAKRELVGAIIFVSWWAIWRLQNDAVFMKDRSKDESLFDDVYFSFIRYSSRNNKHKRKWIEWLQNPLIYMFLLLLYIHMKKLLYFKSQELESSSKTPKH
ncbi:hypothetical protein L1987_06755 [Smallanthus sonchifolius]|uniref:Uncharacterized protein n=1 Tax=Smallanthus sonchifolius TaxID=185202 RepID=A0ACB9JZD2_9ASTR|nr:hypothetical protein L1987_06755 [Smallanthus sonchifolius]